MSTNLPSPPPCYFSSTARGAGDVGQLNIPYDETEEVPVLIIGQSMVGMALSALLAFHGVESVGVEKHASTAIHPRAALFLTRTLEIFRQMGFEKQVVDKSRELYDLSAGINAVTSLAGEEVAVYLKDMNSISHLLTNATGRVFLTQHAFEPILKKHAQSRGATLEFGHEVLSVRELAPGRGVEVLVRDLGTEPGHEHRKGHVKRFFAQYVVAADGNRSPVRKQLDIEMKGYGVMSKSLTIYFKAPMYDIVHGTEWGANSVSNGVIYVNNDYVRGFFRLDRHLTHGFLVVNTLGERGTEASRFLPADLSNEAAITILQHAIGSSTVPISIELVAPWDAVSENAERYMSASGQIFVAGDAAHTVPPTGGFGGNTGIADAHNLAWKLAMVLRGEAAPELLRSYDDERQFVGQFTVEQAYSRYVHRIAPELPDKGEPERGDYEIEIGYGYFRGRGIVRSDADELASRRRYAESFKTSLKGYYTEDPTIATGMPGFRAAYVPLRRSSRCGGPGELTSTLDLVEKNFVLFTHASSSDADAAWSKAAQRMGGRLNCKLDSYVITDILDLDRPEGEDYLIDPNMLGKFRFSFGLKPGGCTLVRPDGFIAWRSDGPPAAGSKPEEELERVLRKILFPAGTGADQGATEAQRGVDSTAAALSAIRPSLSLAATALHAAGVGGDLDDILYLDDAAFKDWTQSLSGVKPLHIQMIATWRRKTLQANASELESMRRRTRKLEEELERAKKERQLAKAENDLFRQTQAKMTNVMKGLALP